MWWISVLLHSHEICQKRTCQNDWLNASIIKLVLCMRTKIMLRANVLKIKKRTKSENLLLRIQKTSKINENKDTHWSHDESFWVKEWSEELIKFSQFSQCNECFKYNHSIWLAIEFIFEHTKRWYDAV